MPTPSTIIDTDLPNQGQVKTLIANTGRATASNYAAIPAQLDQIRIASTGNSVLGQLITDTSVGRTYRVDAQPAYGTAGTTSNYSLTPLSQMGDPTVAAALIPQLQQSLADNAQLRDSLSQAGQTAATAAQGANTARDGANTATSGANAAAQGANTARDGANAARDGAVAATAGANTARDGAVAATGGANAAAQGANTARDGAVAATGNAAAVSATVAQQNLDLDQAESARAARFNSVAGQLEYQRQQVLLAASNAQQGIAASLSSALGQLAANTPATYAQIVADLDAGEAGRNAQVAKQLTTINYAATSVDQARLSALAQIATAAAVAAAGNPSVLSPSDYIRLDLNRY
jgi:hypothetical protein